MANGFVCSKCGKVYDAGVKFCNECGGCVTAAAEAPAESKRECLIQRTPAEWVDAFFKKSVSKFVNAGFFTRRIENFYFAMNCGDRYVITPQKIEKY